MTAIITPTGRLNHTVITHVPERLDVVVIGGAGRDAAHVVGHIAATASRAA